MTPEHNDTESPEVHEPEVETPIEPAPQSLSPAPQSLSPAPQSLSPAWKWAIGAVIAVLLLFPVIQRLRHPSDTAATAGSRVTLSDSDVQVQKSLELYNAGKFDEAVAAGQEAVRLNPKSVLGYNNLAVSYLQLKKYDQALASVRQALQIEPGLELAKNNEAWILREQAKGNGGPPSQAGAPGTAAYFIDESLKNYNAGQFQECINNAKEALRVNPGMPEAYNNISAAYLKLEMWDRAIENAQLALNAKPDFELARGNLNWAQWKKNGSPASPK